MMHNRKIKDEFDTGNGDFDPFYIGISAKGSNQGGWINEDDRVRPRKSHGSSGGWPGFIDQGIDQSSLPKGLKMRGQIGADGGRLKKKNVPVGIKIIGPREKMVDGETSGVRNHFKKEESNVPEIAQIKRKKNPKKGMYYSQNLGVKRPVGRPRKIGIRCYYCNELGHVPVICPNKFMFNTDNLSTEKDYLVNGTDGGTWKEMWIMDPKVKNHMTGNKSLFKNFKRNFGIYKQKQDFVFSHGIGEVKIPVDRTMKTIPGVGFVPSLEKNVLSMKRLSHQGIEVLIKGDRFMLKRTFDGRKGFDVFGPKGEDEIEREYVKKFYKNIDKRSIGASSSSKQVELEKMVKKKIGEVKKKHEKGKQPMVEKWAGSRKSALVTYVECLRENPEIINEKCRDEVWSYLELVHNDVEDTFEKELTLEGCLRFVEMIKIHEQFIRFKDAYKKEFHRIMEWFTKEYMSIIKKEEIPPTVSDGKPVDLLNLYIAVNGEGGYAEACKKDKWKLIAFKLGFKCEDASELMFVYLKYIDLLEWYFLMMKDNMEIVREHDKKRMEMENKAVDSEDSNEEAVQDTKKEPVKVLKQDEVQEEDDDLVIILND